MILISFLLALGSTYAQTDVLPPLQPPRSVRPAKPKGAGPPLQPARPLHTRPTRLYQIAWHSIDTTCDFPHAKEFARLSRAIRQGARQNQNVYPLESDRADLAKGLGEHSRRHGATFVVTLNTEYKVLSQGSPDLRSRPSEEILINWQYQHFLLSHKGNDRAVELKLSQLGICSFTDDSLKIDPYELIDAFLLTDPADIKEWGEAVRRMGVIEFKKHRF